MSLSLGVEQREEYSLNGRNTLAKPDPCAFSLSELASQTLPPNNHLLGCFRRLSSQFFQVNTYDKINTYFGFVKSIGINKFAH